MNKSREKEEYVQLIQEQHNKIDTCMQQVVDHYVKVGIVKPFIDMETGRMQLHYNGKILMMGDDLVKLFIGQK